MKLRAPVLAISALFAGLTWSESGHADEPSAVLWTPHANEVTLSSPDARSFLAPSPFAYWAGTERILDGELALATPRPVQGSGFLPAPDDHLHTSAYLSESTSYVSGEKSWNVVELSSLHDLRGGAVLGMNFRVDARTQTALQGIVTVALPLPRGFWLLPTLGAGADSDVAPQVIFGAEARSDRSKPLGYMVGVEGSSWTYDRTRVVGKVGAIYRLSDAAAIEERVALGAWDGSRVAGDLAVQWISAARQILDDRTALYERATLTRGLAMPPTGMAPDRSTFSTDFSIGVRRNVVSSFGFAVQLDGGAQESTFHRFGGELTLYGTPF
jgi:hypothetical protein